MKQSLGHACPESKGKQDPDSLDIKFLIGELRCAALRARLAAAEIDTIGVALKARMIDGEAALAWAADVGAIGYIDGESVNG